MNIIEQANNHVVHVLVGIVAHARTLKMGLDITGPDSPQDRKQDILLGAICSTLRW